MTKDFSGTVSIDREKPSGYDIIIRNDYKELSERLVELSVNPSRKLCIVTDSNVSPLYLKEVRDILLDGFSKVITFEFPAGEENKNLNIVNNLYQTLIENRFDRADMLVALGGGVVGDLTGFASATYLRGIDFVQLPTTLLSDVDSSIGGKTGVDFSHYKNMVGAFHMPSLVYINASTLRTLPKRQFSSGMAEIIKHGLIYDSEYYSFLKDDSTIIFSGLNDGFDVKTCSSGSAESNNSAISHMIEGSCRIKAHFVQEDPTEKGIRACLNFGHTIGHAVEKLSDFRLFHGECVAIGMRAASFISMKAGYIPESGYGDIIDTIKRYDLPVAVPEGFSFSSEDVLSAMKNDKKVLNGKLRFILLKRIGEAFISDDVSEEALLEAISEVMPDV